ncbi:MAG TPA: phosphohistidine phosphatase SixA [Gammaproteobacteria bacterium]|nr:phosphohistidine phosphatase SixA [Gammaproteobacteria bacterium]
MKLYLVQHGEAVPKAEDPERPLSAQGRRDVRAVATLLQSAGVRVERVWHSGKVRAEQTAQLLAGAVLPRGRKPQAIEGIDPRAPVADFSIDADVWEADTLVVGHLPFMARLVALLTTGDSDRDIVAYSPGSVVCLERADAGHWVVLWMLRPDLLP